MIFFVFTIINTVSFVKVFLTKLLYNRIQLVEFVMCKNKILLFQTFDFVIFALK